MIGGKGAGLITHIACIQRITGIKIITLSTKFIGVKGVLLVMSRTCITLKPIMITKKSRGHFAYNLHNMHDTDNTQHIDDSRKMPGRNNALNMHNTHNTLPKVYCR